VFAFKTPHIDTKLPETSTSSQRLNLVVTELVDHLAGSLRIPLDIASSTPMNIRASFGRSTLGGRWRPPSARCCSSARFRKHTILGLKCWPMHRLQHHDKLLGTHRTRLGTHRTRLGIHRTRLKRDKHQHLKQCYMIPAIHIFNIQFHLNRPQEQLLWEGRFAPCDAALVRRAAITVHCTGTFQQQFTVTQPIEALDILSLLNWVNTYTTSYTNMLFNPWRWSAPVDMPYLINKKTVCR